MTFTKFTSAAAIALLAACGGTNTPMVTPMTIGSIGTPGVAAETVGNDIVITANGTSNTLVRLPALDHGAFLAYQDPTADSLAFQASQGETGASVAFINPTTNPVATVAYGAAAPDFPQAPFGSGTFSGDYTAIVVDNAGNFQTRITGDAMLTVDFDNAPNVTGTINNRETLGLFSANPTGLAAADVMLTGAMLGSDYTFNGTTTGGEILSIGATASPGTYEGLISNDFTAVGAVQIGHNDGTADATELGAFITPPNVQ